MLAKPMLNQLLLFGDSQFQRGHSLVALLQHLYRNKLDVVNRGFSGYTTREALAILPHVVGKEPAGSEDPNAPRVAACLVWLNNNDSIKEGEPQHRPIEQFRRNLRSIVDHLASLDAAQPTPILLLTPAACIESPSSGHCVRNKAAYSLAMLDEFGVGTPGFRENVHVVDVFTPMVLEGLRREEGLAELLDEDGLHIRPAGYEVIFDVLSAALLRAGVSPTLLPFSVPDYVAAVQLPHVTTDDFAPRRVAPGYPLRDGFTQREDAQEENESEYAPLPEGLDALAKEHAARHRAERIARRRLRSA